MKKKLFAIIITIIMLSAFGFAACGIGGNNSNNDNSNNENNNNEKNQPEGDLKKISASLDSLLADLSGAKKLGIMPKNKISSVSPIAFTSNGQGQNDDGQGGGRKGNSLTVVKIDDEDNIEEIDFIDEDTEETISQDDFDLEIYKLHVVGDFTVMSYISSYWRNNIETQPVKNNGETMEYQSYYEFLNWNQDGKYSRVERNIIDRTKGVPQNFDNTAFYNNEHIKSYIMDNQSGKIYGTENFEVFDIINGLLVVRGYDVFILDVYNFFTNESDELVLKDVLSNKDVLIYDAFKDNDGWVYVHNSSINDYVDVDNKIIYFTSAYRFASNGVVYQFGDGMPVYSYTFPIKEMKNGVPSNVTSKDFDRLITFYYDLTGNGWTWQSEKTFMKDGIYFYDWNIEYGTSYETLHWGRDTINNRDVYLNLNYGGTKYSSGIFGFGKSTEFALYFDNGSIDYFDLDWDEVASGGEIKLIGRESVISGVQKVPSYWAIQNGYWTLLDNVYSKVSPTGTEYYQIILGTEGAPVAELIKNNVFNENIIIIQPLN